MEDNRIVVAFDIHETILRGLIGYINRVYKGDKELIRKISHIACNSVFLVAVYSIFSRKNKIVCRKMKELYKQKNVFKVVLLTDSYKSCRRILNFILKMRGINYFDELICRDYIYEGTIEHKLKKIIKYGIKFIYDDNPNMRAIMKSTDCYTIGMID